MYTLKYSCKVQQNKGGYGSVDNRSAVLGGAKQYSEVYKRSHITQDTMEFKMILHPTQQRDQSHWFIGRAYEYF